MPRSKAPASSEASGERPALLLKIETGLGGYTPTQRAIASHILANPATIAFDTSESLADRLGISAISVGRFARQLGYANFKALKSELRSAPGERLPWLIGAELAQFVDAPGASILGDGSLEHEIRALVAVYRMIDTERWQGIAALLARAKLVHIAGFQTERGIATLLANHLQFMRDGVRLVDTSAGNYADVFASEEKDTCLVVLDIRRYSRQSYLISEQAHRENITLIVLTDSFCDWAHKFTHHVLSIPTQSGLFWSSPVALVCAVNLLVNSVIKLVGADVEQRLDKLTLLHQTFTGYVGHPPPARRF